MKKIKIMTVALLFIAAVLPGSLAGQSLSQNIEQREHRRQYYQDYSRWSLGAHFGLSSMWGDLRSFSDGKTYVGGLFGLSAGYQLSPTIGFSLHGEFGTNKLGATSRNKNFLLEDWGYTFHGVAPKEEMMPTYGDIYSKVKSWHLGLTWDINVNNLIAGNDGNRNRRWTVIASPGIYLQLFDPVLKAKSGDYTARYPLYNNWNLGLGGDVALRWKVSRAIDLQLKTGARWIDNNKFDGIRSAVTMKNSGMGYVSVGVIWKIGRRKDHMLYASTRRYVNKMFDATPVVNTIEKTVEKPVEKIVQVEVKVKDLQTPLATVHFDRGNAVIDEIKYAVQLQDIVSTLKSIPDTKIQIWGYADHTGTPEINDEISLARAQALRDYLVNHGIPSDRIARVRGMGADADLTGERGFSEEARRAEIVKN